MARWQFRAVGYSCEMDEQIVICEEALRQYPESMTAVNNIVFSNLQDYGYYYSDIADLRKLFSLQNLLQIVSTSPQHVDVNEDWVKIANRDLGKIDFLLMDGTRTISSIHYHTFSIGEYSHNYDIYSTTYSGSWYGFYIYPYGYRSGWPFFEIRYYDGVGYIIQHEYGKNHDIIGHPQTPEQWSKLLPLEQSNIFINLSDPRKIYQDDPTLYASPHIIWKANYFDGTTTWSSVDWASIKTGDAMPEPTDRKGRYEGLPQSNIPLRQFIPTGIDYRHNITVYDETEYNTRNMFLTNLVGTIPYTLIDYRVPRGTLRVATDLQFTHFICCSFTSDNEPRVYRVTSYHVLGDNLVEYDFELDGLKDYFQHFGVTTSNNFLVDRCTVKNTWNKLLNDTAFYDGTFTDHVIEGTSVYPYYAMNTPSGVFVLSEGEYRNFCRWVTEDVAQYSQAIVGQISSVHIVPYTSSNNVYIEHSGGLTFSLADGEPVTFTPSSGVMYRFHEEFVVGGRYDRYIEGFIPSCAEIVETFREIFDSNAVIHIPFYGDFQPSLDILTRLSVGGLNFRYYISPVDGTCAVSFYPYVDVLPVVSLPTRTLPVNGTVSAMYSINREREASTTQSAYSTAVNVASNLLSGNVGGAIGSLVGMATNQLSIDRTAENSKQTIKERQSVTAVSGSGGGAVVCRVAYISFQVPNLSIEMDDIFASMGYPVQKLWTQTGAVSGNRYWLKMLGKVKGPQWYADLVTADIERDFIIYNY